MKNAYYYYSRFFRQSYAARERSRHLYDEAVWLCGHETQIVLFEWREDGYRTYTMRHRSVIKEVELSSVKFREMRSSLYRFAWSDGRDGDNNLTYRDAKFVFKNKKDELFYCLKHGLLEA